MRDITHPPSLHIPFLLNHIKMQKHWSVHVRMWLLMRKKRKNFYIYNFFSLLLIYKTWRYGQ